MMRLKRRSRGVFAAVASVAAAALAVGIGAPVIANSNAAAGSRFESTADIYTLDAGNYAGEIPDGAVFQTTTNGVTPDKWDGHYDATNPQKTWTPIGADGEKGKTLKQGDGDYEAVAYLASIAKSYVADKDSGKLDVISAAINTIAGVKMDDALQSVYDNNADLVNKVIGVAKDQAGPYKTNYSIEGSGGMRAYIYKLSGFSITAASGSQFSPNGINALFGEDANGQEDDHTTNGVITIDGGEATPSDPNVVPSLKFVDLAKSNQVFSYYDTYDECSVNAAGITATFKDLPSSTINVSNAIGDENTEASSISSLLRYGDTTTKVMNLSPCGDGDEQTLDGTAYVGSDANSSRWREITPDNISSIENFYDEATITGLKNGFKYTLNAIVQNASTFETVVEGSTDFTFDREKNVVNVKMPVGDLLNNGSNNFVIFLYVSDEDGNTVIQSIDYENENQIIKRTTGVQDITLTSSADDENGNEIMILAAPGAGQSWNSSITSTLTVGQGLDENMKYFVHFYAVNDSTGGEISESDPVMLPYADNKGEATGSFGVPYVERFVDKGFHVKAVITDIDDNRVASYDGDDNKFTVKYAFPDPDPEGPSFDPATVKSNVADAVSDSIKRIMGADGYATRDAIAAYDKSSKSADDASALVDALSATVDTSGFKLPEGEDKLKALRNIAEGAFAGSGVPVDVSVNADDVVLNEDGTAATVPSSAITVKTDGKTADVLAASSLSLVKDGTAWKIVPTTSDFKAGTAPVDKPTGDGDNGTSTGSTAPPPTTTNGTTSGDNTSNKGSVTVTKKAPVGTDVDVSGDGNVNSDATGNDAGGVSGFLKKTGAPIALTVLLGGALTAAGVTAVRRGGFKVRRRQH